MSENVLFAPNLEKNASESVAESEVLLSEHVVLLNADEVEKTTVGVDLFGVLGYTAENSKLEGHEEAFNKIRLAKERAADFLRDKKAEANLMLSEDTEADMCGNLTQTSSSNCGPFHDFVDGKAVCKIHTPCLCSVCIKSTSGTESGNILNEVNIESIHQDHTSFTTSKELPSDINSNTHSASAEDLFENFYNIHKKLPFSVNSMAHNKRRGVLTDGKVMDTVESSVSTSKTDKHFKNVQAEIEQAMVNTLPYEIIQKIFSYLNHTDLAHTAAVVCKKWKEFAYDPIHWTMLHIERAMSSYDFAYLLKRVPLLKELYLYGQCIDNDEMLFIVQSCPQLRILDLGFVTTLFDGFISAIAEHCQHLEYLNVEGCNEFNPRCIDMLCEGGRVSKLKGLNVSHCTKLTDESIINLTDVKENLDMLNVDGISWLSDGTISYVAKCRGATLKCLYVDGADLSVQTVQAIAENCPCIEVLGWSFAELLLDSALVYIKQMGSLRELTLKKGLELTDEGAQFLFDQDSQLNKLKKLDFSEWTNMRDDGILALSKCCGSNLTHLALCWCWNITDVGLKCIIEKCTILVDLDLLGIDKIKGHCLEDIPVKMTLLKRLHLRQCNKIEDDLIVEIIKKMPKLKAYNYYGDEFEVHKM